MQQHHYIGKRCKKQKENRYKEKKIVSFFVCLIARSGVMCYSIKQNVFIVFMEYKKRSLIIRTSKVLFDSIRFDSFCILFDSIRFIQYSTRFDSTYFSGISIRYDSIRLSRVESFDNSTRFRTLVEIGSRPAPPPFPHRRDRHMRKRVITNVTDAWEKCVVTDHDQRCKPSGCAAATVD